ncbi:aquaporin AQPAnG isoform X1 [Vespula squamosa]|uniref:Aquaporin AQPAnG isoform X1 n=1 Tax=Vespula squamosa TaxID=30214 RepID=A0ABD2BDQ9_VESSQ
MVVVQGKANRRVVHRSETKRDTYVNLWREFLVFHSSVNKTAKRLALAKGQRPNVIMNVSTVFPEGHTGNGQETRRKNSYTSKEDEDQTRELCYRVKDIVGLEEVAKIEFLVPLFAEALGTFLLVLIGCASCITWVEGQSPTVLHIAFTFGLAVAALAQARTSGTVDSSETVHDIKRERKRRVSEIVHVRERSEMFVRLRLLVMVESFLGPISGCHVNPAVTVGLFVSGNCSFLKTLCYIVCQSCGAIAGAVVLKMLTPAQQVNQGLGATDLAQGVEAGQGIVMEAIITFLLVLVVHAVTDPKRSDTKGWAPLAIGLAISVSHMAAVPFTGSSMNPARSLGPAVILTYWSNHWVYWVGPIVGGAIAGGLYKMGFRIIMIMIMIIKIKIKLKKKKKNNTK